MSNQVAAPRAGKHLFLDILHSEGVEIIFGNPGTTELPLLDAFVVEDRLRYVLGLNEVVVMGMADGWAQATGKLAVCNLHAAPGLGNAMGMLYNAAKAGAPVLVTAGQQDMSIRLTEPLLWDDLATMARPLCKWSFEVNSIEELPRAVRRRQAVGDLARTLVERRHDRRPDELHREPDQDQEHDHLNDEGTGDAHFSSFSPERLVDTRAVTWSNGR